MTPSPEDPTLEAALEARGITGKALDKKFGAAPITIRISGPGWQLETMISLETVRKVVQCINQR
jgi:hypothetical protein